MVKTRIGNRMVVLPQRRGTLPGVNDAHRNIKSYEALMQAARKNERAGDEQGALSCYTRALKINPSSMDAAYNRASSLLLLGWKPEAIQAFTVVIAAGRVNNPFYYIALIERGATYRVLEDLPAAARDFLEVYSNCDGPNRAMAAINLGGIVETQEALTYFDTAATIFLEHMDIPRQRDYYYMALFYKGITLCRLERMEEGIKCFEIVARITNPVQREAEQILYTLARQR